MYTQEQFNEIVKLLRETQEILQEHDAQAEAKELARLEPVGERHSL
jgi:hypothetical protein